MYVNDSAPMFDHRRQYDFDVEENSPADVQIGQLRATDADGPPFDQV